MGLFAERTITFTLTNLSFSRRLSAWFGSEGGQKKLPGKSGLCLVQIDSWRRVLRKFRQLVKTEIWKNDPPSRSYGAAGE